MVEVTPRSNVTPELAAWEIQARETARLVAAIRPVNKAAVFDALARAGITIVIVRFDGYGDSGQIEDIEAYAGEESVTLPSDPIEVVELVGGSTQVQRIAVAVHDAIERLAYDFLEQTHGGWEDGGGAYGDFTFDVAKRTITLAYNARYIDSDYSEHVF